MHVPRLFRTTVAAAVTAALLLTGFATVDNSASAQPAKGAPAKATRSVSSISPRVADPVATEPGFYTFTLTAAAAKAVTVTGSWGLSDTNISYPLAQSGANWTVVLGPLTPGIYSYKFTVDGVATRDPFNINTVHSDPTLTTFLVPGASAAFLTPHAGAKGKLSILNYHSKVTQTQRSATVWTPPGYSTKRAAAYPTFYLIHGGGGDYLDWVQQGDADVILDNLYDTHKLKPMVVVMVDGNIPGSTGLPEADSFAPELIDSVVPAVQKSFHVSTSPARRALAGLSLGGLQTFNTLLTNPGFFRYVGDFSSGYFPAVIDQLRATDGALLSNPAVNAETRLFRIYVGNPMDIAYTNNIATRALFDQYGVHYTFAGSFKTGGHVWTTWQHDLDDFAPRLFR